MPNVNLPLPDTEFVAFDLETTGLYPVSCRIVEFGAVTKVRFMYVQL